MSVEAPKTVDEAQPVETKPIESAPEAPVSHDAPAVETLPTEAPTTVPAVDATPATNGLKKGETVVEATPASEGVLGYKAPGFLKQFYFSKHFFWFSDEAVPSESLNAYIRSDKTHSVGHEHAAWARESGKGILFHSKRAEDKSSPSGVILLHEVSNVTKEGLDVFSFNVGAHTHKFEAANSGERDSWVVAIEKKVDEAKGLKDDITGRDSYKKNLEEYAKSPAQIIAGTASSRSKSKEPKTLNGATAVPPTTQAKTEETPVAAPAEEKKTTQKERSQSRKRASIFGSILGKKDEKETEHEAKKEAKAEDKSEKKAEKQAIKEEKKEEAAVKKEEAKATHDSSKATEAAEAAVVAAVPTAAVLAAEHDKKEEKKLDKEHDKNGATTPTDKKGKRGSVFGSLFGKKGVTSPTAEKGEKEVGPATPAKDDVPPVSETAPVLDEPIHNKPIDTAAVTAPADAIAAEPAAVEPTKETAPATTTEEPKTEKKGGFLAGFIKKAEGKKEEPKEDKVVTDATTTAPVETADGTTDTPVTKEERPANEKRRSSLFSGLSTIKRKNREEKETSEVNGETPATETKREKSPLPSKIGGLFRRPSKAVKSEDSAKEATPATETKSEIPTIAESTPAVEESGPATTVPEGTESKIVGDVVPDELHSAAPVHDAVTMAPEVKASA